MEALDVFGGVGDRVPGGLAEHLRDVALIDHHVHGAFAAPLDRAGFEASLNEGSTGPVPAFLDGFDSPLGLSVRRWCAPLLGLQPLAGAADYWAARSSRDPDELAATMLSAAGVSHWVVDTGFAADLVTPYQRLAQLGGGRALEIVRLERLVEDLLAAGTAAADLPDAVRAALDAAVAAPEVVGVKTIAAYRTGFDVDWSAPTDGVVAAHARDVVDAGRAGRVDDPVLIAFAVHAAAQRGLPIQVHVGLGDRDLDLHRCDPMLLLPLLRAMPPAPVLLLHCYPFHRQAGYLAQAFDHVHFDVGLAVNHLGTRSSALVAEALELAPFGKQLYSSDAFGPPELHVLGAVLWRRAMGLVLGDWVRAEDCTEDDAVRFVDLIAAGNARRVYRL